MSKDEDVIRQVKEDIDNAISVLPFIAQFWELHMHADEEKQSGNMCHFGRRGTLTRVPSPFYRPISKIINEINDDKA